MGRRRRDRRGKGTRYGWEEVGLALGELADKTVFEAGVWFIGGAGAAGKVVELAELPVDPFAHLADPEVVADL